MVPSVLEEEAGSRPLGLDRSGSLGRSACRRLSSGISRPQPLEDVPDHACESFVPHELAPGRCSDALAGDVVGGRPESTGDDDGIRMLRSVREDADHPIYVVPHRHMTMDVDADAGENLRDVLGIRVGNLAEQELRPDPDDLCVHAARLDSSFSRLPSKKY